MLTNHNNLKLHGRGLGEDHFGDRINVKLMPIVHVPGTIRTRMADNISKSLLQHVSQGLMFAEDVVKERSFQTLPYNRKYLQEILSPADIVRIGNKRTPNAGRVDHRSPDKRHMPCYFHKTAPHRIPPVKRKIMKVAKQMHQQSEKCQLAKEEEEERKAFIAKIAVSTRRRMAVVHQQHEIALELKRGTPLLQPKVLQEEMKRAEVEPTQSPTIEFREVFEPEHARKKREAKQEVVLPPNLWAEYTLTQVTENTANWMAVHHSLPQYRQKLKHFLKEWYGRINQRADLIQLSDSQSDSDDDSGLKAKEKRWKKPDETLLDRVREVMKERNVKETDPYGDANTCAFYRLPAGLRQVKKEQIKEEKAVCNSTAYNIQVPKVPATPLPTLKDFMNPRVGGKMMESDSIYQQHVLIGGKPTHQFQDKANHIVIGDSKYEKLVEPSRPIEPTVWCPDRDHDQDMDTDAVINRVVRGPQRWVQYPQPVDESESWKQARIFKDIDQGGALPAKFSSSEVVTVRDSFPRVQNTIVKIAEEWRNRWYMDMRYADATIEELIRDMADYHPHIRLKAITTCARAAEYRPPPQLGVQLGQEMAGMEHVRLLPEELFTALECCLQDVHSRVQLAAAVALYTLERPVAAAEQVLRQGLLQGSVLDRWTACQCLAYYGECDSDIVSELIKRWLGATNPVHRQQAVTHLTNLSETSSLVHSMIGEQLNSDCWQSRVQACQLLPRLNRHINKDLVNKLTHLMWNDWHEGVRTASAQVLGKTGHGRHVHDQLVERLQMDDERIRVDSLQKLGYLGLMTLKLLTPFVACFSDLYQSVRVAVCQACANLYIQDPEIIHKLLYVLTFDPVWKVKREAIKALGNIKEITPQIRHAIQWAFRYEDHELVRKQACITMMSLGQGDRALIEVLQTHYLTENSKLVQREIARALHKFGISANEDMEMLTKIKAEVRELCQKEEIVKKILRNELIETRQELYRRLLYKAKPKVQPSTPPKPISAKLQERLKRTPPDTVSTQPCIKEESEESDSESEGEIKALFNKAKEGMATPDDISAYTSSRPSTPADQKLIQQVQERQELLECARDPKERYQERLKQEAADLIKRKELENRAWRQVQESSIGRKILAEQKRLWKNNPRARLQACGSPTTVDIGPHTASVSNKVQCLTHSPVPHTTRNPSDPPAAPPDH